MRESSFITLKRVCAAVALALLVCGTTLRAERLPIKTYTTADGLASNEINKIVRDSRGFLWFCTSDGLSRFDGYTFTNFDTDQGLPHNNVTDFLETREGEIWIGTQGGLVKFNPAGRAEKRVAYLGDEGNSAPLFQVVIPAGNDRFSKYVSVVFEDHHGDIWCGTYRGLYRLEQERGRPVLQLVDIGIPHDDTTQHSITDLVEDQHNTLWIATPSGLYRRWSDGHAERYLKRDGLPDDYIQDLLADQQGQLWVGTRGGGLFRFAAEERRGLPAITFSLSSRDGLPTDWVFQLFETADKKFWAATARGLVEFFPNGDEQGNRFHAYSEKNGLTYHDILTLNEDVNGNLWLGSFTGAMKLVHNGFVTYEAQDGIYSIAAIFEDQTGGVWFRGYVLGDGQRSVFEGAKLDLLHADQAQLMMRFGYFDGQNLIWMLPNALQKLKYFGWVGQQVTLQARSGEWWIGTGDGLFRLSAARSVDELQTARLLAHYTEKDGLAAPQVFRLFEDSQQNIWVSTISSEKNGLALWERRTETLRDLANAPGLPSIKENLARAFAEDRAGNVWLGFSSGLARYHHGRFAFFTTQEGLPGVGIQYLSADRAGRLWIASSQSGLIRVDDPTAEQPVFTSYTTAQGLSSNNSMVITEDLSGHIYVVTGRGLDQLDPRTGRIKHFTTADGLAFGEILSAFCDRSGALWVGTHKGLSRLAPAHSEESASPPPIMVTGLHVAGALQPVSALGEQNITLADLAPQQNQLQIDFTGLSFALGERLRYQYKLEGADSDWSVPTEQRTVNYANLSVGHYRFLVRAINADGASSTNPAVITFTILPPLWQRWWFIALAALALGGLTYALFRYRVRRIVELANIRTRIAADLHDDIGANLTRIAILSEVADSQVRDESPRLHRELSSIAEISRESVASISDIVWAINPKRDHLRDLVQRMRRFATEIFATRKIDFQFRAPADEQTLRLGANIRRDVFLIYKEALNNAVRHSHCTSVEIDLWVERSWLVLKIVDDGRGFDPQAMFEGQGLASMRRRAEGLGGELQINSNGARGTEVVLRIPYRAG